MSSILTGAAHGLCSILQMILSYPSFLDSDPQSAQHVRDSVDWLLSTQQPDGNFVPATDELESSCRPVSEQLVHWCHGAPGMIFTSLERDLRKRSEWSPGEVFYSIRQGILGNIFSKKEESVHTFKADKI